MYMAATFCMFVDENHDKLPALYWLPKRFKDHINRAFIANSVLLLGCLYF